jgi:hypothetical protein
MCDCIKLTNDALQRNGMCLRIGLVVRNGKWEQHIPIATERIDGKKKPVAPPFVATYCPFCGEKQEA